MSLEPEIKFEIALQDFIKSSFPAVDMEPPAMVIISKILNGFNNELIKEMLAIKNVPILNAAQCAVEKKLPKNLKKLALAEAQRQLALFEMGSSIYDDIREVGKKIKMSVTAKGTKRTRDSKTSDEETAAKKRKTSLSTGSKKSKKSVRPKKKLVRSKLPKKPITSKASKTSKVPKKVKKPITSKASKTSKVPKKVKKPITSKASKTSKVPKKVKKPITSKASKTSKVSKKVKNRPSKKEREGVENVYTETPTSVFKEGISKLHSLTHSTLKIENNALGYLSACLYYFSKTMALKLSEKNPTTEIIPKNIKDILAEFSGSNLLQLATSEGIKNVTLFINGLLPLTIDSSKREPPTSGESFRVGLQLFLEKEFFEPIQLDQDSSEYLEHLLLEFLKLFASDAGKLCVLRNIRVMGEDELKMVAEDILAEELRLHSIIRGDKAVSDFQRGLRQYSESNTKNAGMPPDASEKKKELNSKPKKQPKLDVKSTAKPKARKVISSNPETSQASKSTKPSKKIKKLVSKVLKKK